MTTVLLAEDERPIRAAQKASLRRIEGVEVIEASDGVEALELIIELAPEVVVLDVMMPRMGGVEVIRRVRVLDISPQILVMTALVQPGLIEELRELGVHQVMTKPFKVADFVRTVAEMIDEINQ
jgi:two-component system response regulator VicR